MRRRAAAIGSAAFFVAAPGTVAGAIPWWLTRWHAGTLLPGLWAVLRPVGVPLLLAGLVGVVLCFLRFVREGSGTPAPIAPTARLVVGGLYRYVRNPMYLAVLACVFGQALLLADRRLLAYGAVIALVFGAFVRLYEEPALRRQFGDAYLAYQRAVPAWWPRRTPWNPDDVRG